MTSCWTMAVSPPEGFRARDVLATLAMTLGGTLRDTDPNLPAWVLPGDRAVVEAEFDTKPFCLRAHHLMLDIYATDAPACEAIANEIAAELNSRDDWDALASPPEFEQTADQLMLA